MKPKKTTEPVKPAPENKNDKQPLKERLKDRLLDRYDLEELFNVTRNTIYNWCKAGLLSFSKIGRKKYYDAQEIENLIEKRKQTMVPGEEKKKKS